MVYITEVEFIELKAQFIWRYLLAKRNARKQTVYRMEKLINETKWRDGRYFYNINNENVNK
jgi:hypothetical protein